MRIPLLLGLFMAGFTNLFSQSSPLLPVRIQFKNAFIDTTGLVKVRTRFDHLGDINLPWYGQEWSRSGYFLAETNGKVGLVDSTLQEVVAPIWQEAQPVNHDLFLVAARTNAYTVVDRSGKDLLGALYNRVEFPDQGRAPYFIVKQNGRCGVRHKSGRLNIPMEHRDIQYIEAGNGLFKVKKPGVDSFWTLLSPENKPVLDQPKTDIQSAGKYYFAARSNKVRDGIWVIYEPAGKEKIELPYLGIHSFVGLNRYLLGVKTTDSSKIFLYVFATNKIEVSNIDSLWALDENLALARIWNRINIIDSVGHRIELDSGLVDLKPGAGKIFRVRCGENKWGLFSLDTKKTLTCEYDFISPFEGRFARCTKNRRAGALDRSGKEVVPAQYDWVKVEGDIVEAYSGDYIYQYEFDQKGKLNLSGPFKYQEYRIAYSGLYYEMEDLLEEASMEDPDSTGTAQLPAVEEPQPPEALKVTVTELKAGDEGQIDAGHSLFWVLTGDGYLLSKAVSPDGKKSKAVRHDVFKKLYRLEELDWTLAVHRMEPVNNTLSQTLGFSTGIYRMEIFDNASGQFIPDLSFLGIRIIDFTDSLSFAAFIDLNGRMGLIDRKGRQATGRDGRPLRFDYIGRLREGKIRVCTRGAIRVLGAKEKTDTKITTTRGLMIGFMTQKVPGSEDKNMKNNDLAIGPKNRAAPLWGYMNAKAETLIEPTFEFASDFKDSSAINLKNNKWGVIDHKGKIVVPFRYDLVRPDSNYWRTYVLNPQKIFFDVNGLRFPDSIGALLSRNPEGLFLNKDTNGLYGYADAFMRMIIPGQFKTARYFSEGLAAVRDRDNKWAFIDTTGKIVLRPQLPENQPIIDAGDFHEGLCWVKEATRKKYGYIDRSGKLAIELKFEKAFDFSGGAAIVGVGIRENHRRAIINAKGEYVVLPDTYSSIFPFNAYGFARVCEPHVKKVKDSEGRDSIVNTLVCGMVNTNGDLVLPVSFEKIISSPEGFTVQSIDSSDWGFYDLQGKALTGMEYGNASEISQGMSVVKRTQNRYYYLDVKADMNAFYEFFKSASPFYDGYAVISTDEKDEFGSEARIINIQGEIVKIPYGISFYREGRVGAFRFFKKGPKEEIKIRYFLSPEGKPLFHRSFANIQPFTNGLAAVVPKNTVGMINTRGLMVIPPKYAFIKREKLKNTHLALSVKPKYKRGLYTKRGRLIVEPEFDRLVILPNGLLRTEWGDEIGYLRLRDNFWVWPMQR